MYLFQYLQSAYGGMTTLWSFRNNYFRLSLYTRLPLVCPTQKHGSLSPITMAMSYSMIKLLHTRFYKWRRYYPLQTNIFLNWKQNWTFVKRALSGVSIDTFYIVNYLISIDGPWQGGFNQCISISVMVFLLKEILLTNKCVYYCEVYKRKYFLCENESFISLDLTSLESPDRLLNLMSF